MDGNIVNGNARPDAVRRGVRFLQNEDMNSVPVGEIQHFLSQVGLTNDEISQAFMIVRGHLPAAASVSVGIGAVPAITAAAASVAPSSIPKTPSSTSWLGSMMKMVSAGVAAGYLWEHFDVTQRIRDWLETDDEAAPEAAEGVLAENSFDVDATRAQTAQRRRTMAPIAPPDMSEVEGFALQRTQIADALDNIRRIEKENAAGLEELRALLQDVNMSMHTTLGTLQMSTFEQQNSMRSSMQVMASDITGIRRDLSIMSSELNSFTTSRGHSKLEDFDTSNIVEHLNDTTAHSVRTVMYGGGDDLASAMAQVALSTDASPNLHAASSSLIAAHLLLCRQNSASALRYGAPTLVMVIRNLIANRGAPRYRRIVTTNDIIRKSIVSLHGHRNYLECLGFKEDSSLSWKWSPSNMPTALSSDEVTTDVLGLLDHAARLLEHTVKLCDTCASLFGAESGDSPTTTPAAEEAARLPEPSLAYKDVVKMILENKSRELPGIHEIEHKTSKDADVLLKDVVSSFAPKKPWSPLHPTHALAPNDALDISSVSPIRQAAPADIISSPVPGQHSAGVTPSRAFVKGPAHVSSTPDSVVRVKTFEEAIQLGTSMLGKQSS